MQLRSLMGPLVLLLASGCGYSLGYRVPPSVRTVAVPIFQNESFPLRREVEYEITSAFRTEILARTPLELVDSADADMIVHGTIRQYDERVTAEGPSDEKIESLLVVTVFLVVEDRRNRLRLETEVRVLEPLSTQLGETLRDARRRAIRNLSERMLLEIEDWEGG